jgi:hypothetical protein
MLNLLAKKTSRGFSKVTGRNRVEDEVSFLLLFMVALHALVRSMTALFLLLDLSEQSVISLLQIPQVNICRSNLYIFAK